VEKKKKQTKPDQTGRERRRNPPGCSCQYIVNHILLSTKSISRSCPAYYLTCADTSGILCARTEESITRQGREGSAVLLSYLLTFGAQAQAQARQTYRLRTIVRSPIVSESHHQQHHHPSPSPHHHPVTQSPDFPPFKHNLLFVFDVRFPSRARTRTRTHRRFRLRLAAEYSAANSLLISIFRPDRSAGRTPGTKLQSMHLNLFFPNQPHSYL
jgi:hypothetical protein